MAITVGGAMSWAFFILGPAMAVIPLTDRISEHRRVRRERQEFARELLRTHPSPGQWAHSDAGMLTWWNSGCSAAPTELADGLVRLGLQQKTLVRVDLEAGLLVTGHPDVAKAAHRAISMSCLRVHPPAMLQKLKLENRDHSPSTLCRWVLEVKPDGAASLRDRFDAFGRREEFDVDLLPERFTEQLHALTRPRFSMTLAGLDLDDVCAHAVISGTTGSGKTEFMLAWIAHLSQLYSPTEMALAVIDFKGGGAFARLARLPHLRHVLSDLDPVAVSTAREGLAALMRRRERLLADEGASHVNQLTVRTPRVLVFIDEFAALIASDSEWVTLVTDIAARGRALGVHVILATQRFASVRVEKLLANISLRILLRPGDRDESMLMLGSADGWDAQLSLGQALVSRASGAPEVLEFTPASSLASLVDNARTARNSELSLADQPEPLWCEPLREAPSRQTTSDRREIFLGARPNHDALRYEPVVWQPACDGLLLCVSSDARFREHFARLVAGAHATITALPITPAAAWDALDELVENPLAVSALTVPECDVLISSMPAAWREEFTDRLFGLCQLLVAAGMPVCVGVSHSGAIAARWQQIRHVILTSAQPAQPAQPAQQGLVTAVINGTPFVASSAEPKVAGEIAAPWCGKPVALTLDPQRRTVVVTNRKALWSAALADATVCSVDEMVSRMFTQPVNVGVEQVLIDDISPSEFRALRLSSRILPPPEVNTAFELAISGDLVRVDISHLWARSATEPRESRRPGDRHQKHPSEVRGQPG